MCLPEILHLINNKIITLKSCNVKKQYRMVIPTEQIFKKITGYAPDYTGLELWLKDVIYWIDIYEEINIGYLYVKSMREVKRKKEVAKIIKELFTSRNRPQYLRISYAKAEKLATYLQRNQLDIFGNEI